MLVEIPDLEVIVSVTTAFLVGLFAVYLFNRLRPQIINKKNEFSNKKYLEYYENQLIDMKIRMDVLEMGPRLPTPDLKHSEMKMERVLVKEPENKKPRRVLHRMDSDDIVDNILRLITKKSMTSRDIQITVGKTREHTSRTLKRLFEGGFVERNSESKPYTYSITEKGSVKIRVMQPVILK